MALATAPRKAQVGPLMRRPLYDPTVIESPLPGDRSQVEHRQIEISGISPLRRRTARFHGALSVATMKQEADDESARTPPQRTRRPRWGPCRLGTLRRRGPEYLPAPRLVDRPRAALEAPGALPCAPRPGAGDGRPWQRPLGSARRPREVRGRGVRG